MRHAVYLDANATTPLRDAARAAMLDSMAAVGNPSSVHRFGRLARRTVEDARERVAALVNAAPRQVVFTGGATEANNWALAGCGRPRRLAAATEHPSVLATATDIEIVPVSRTVGQNRVVDELILRFTHDVQMDWMLPGVPPTGKRVEVANVVVVEFDADGKLVSEHIYWDQAAVLVQLGLLDRARLPVTGVESARKVLDQRYCPSNELIRRT